MRNTNGWRVGIVAALAIALAAPLLTGCGRSGGGRVAYRAGPARPAPGAVRVVSPPARRATTYTPPPTYTPSRPTERMCFGCRGTGSIGPFGNAYSGAGYKPATSCPSCGGSGRVRN